MELITIEKSVWEGFQTEISEIKQMMQKTYNEVVSIRATTPNKKAKLNRYAVTRLLGLTYYQLEQLSYNVEFQVKSEERPLGFRVFGKQYIYNESEVLKYKEYLDKIRNIFADIRKKIS